MSTESNISEKDERSYNEKDVDYILEMLKHKFKEFKKSTLTEPFYLKAKRTLKKLMSDLAIGSQFPNIERKYFQVSYSTNSLRFRFKTHFVS